MQRLTVAKRLENLYIGPAISVSARVKAANAVKILWHCKLRAGCSKTGSARKARVRNSCNLKCGQCRPRPGSPAYNKRTLYDSNHTRNAVHGTRPRLRAGLTHTSTAVQLNGQQLHRKEGAWRSRGLPSAGPHLRARGPAAGAPAAASQMQLSVQPEAGSHCECGAARRQRAPQMTAHVRSAA